MYPPDRDPFGGFIVLGAFCLTLCMMIGFAVGRMVSWP